MKDSPQLSVAWNGPSLRPDYVRDVERWLRSDGIDTDLRRDHPQALHLESRGRLASVIASGLPVCHALVREVTVVTRQGPAAFTLLGPLITHPEQRGKGLASHLVQAIVQHARDQGQDAVCARPTGSTLYHRQGFTPAGPRRELHLGPARGSLAPGIRPAESRDLVQLWELHQQKPLRADRTLTDLALQMSMPRMRVLVLERHGRAVAYACLGLRNEAADWWHEHGGSDEDAAILIRGAMDVIGVEAATLVVPPYRNTLSTMLRSLQRGTRDGVCALRCALTEQGTADFFLEQLDLG